jgi:asparagine synthase (glutamine-hydrolysing)
MPSSPLDESRAAAAVAQHIGSDHQTIELSPGAVLDTISGLASVWDEPFADPSMLPTALLCRVSSEHFTVCLGGDGGDELFAGYNRHVLGGSLVRRTSAVPARLRAAVAAALLAPPPSMVDNVGRAASRVAPRRVPPNLGDKMQKLGGALRDPGGIWSSLAGVWPEAALGARPHRPATCLVRHHLDEVESLMLADTAAVLPDNMLVKIDRASMAVSLEVRSPFLDPRVLEWAWRQPLSLKANATTGKLVVRHLAARLLPADLAARPKVGFDPPLGDWLRHELRGWAYDLIASSRAAREGWVDREALNEVWAEHLSGRRNWEYRLWSVLMLEAWMERHHPESP